VTVTAKGYLDFSTTVTVQGNMTLPVTMQAATFPLSVNAANVKGAQVLVNGSMVGASPYRGNLAPGSYTVTVQAPGFLAYNESFVLNGPKTITVTLQPATFQLSVNATNVKGAQVLLNGSMAGNAPFNTQLAPGTYTITVQAPGFVSYSESFTLTGPKSINVTLQTAMGTVSVVLPAASINTDLKGGHWSQIQMYVDGVPQKGQIVQLTPGRHLIKITSGGLQVEGFYDIQAGETYTFEPFMGLNLKK
ncbi:MAG: PEGA domain-containing protein, partial [Spirochaetales bacterium]|nr:PEGA domain-containing protein [Spirochaetales bacterium]